MIISAILMVLAYAPGASKAPAEYDIKAAFIYNFITFIDWPLEKVTCPVYMLV